MCWLVYADVTRVYHLPMWLTLNFPNLCASMYMYVRYGGGGPAARVEQKVNSLDKGWTNDVTSCFNCFFYYMTRDMLSLDAYSLPDEWRDIESCTKNRQDGAYKIGIPIVCQNTLPLKQEHNMNITSHTYIYNKSCVNILTLNLSNLWQTFFDCALFVPHFHSIIQPSRTQSDLTATSS